MKKDDWLKLDLNENPYGKIGYTRPDDYEKARKKIARYTEINSRNIVLTNGASHALDLIFSFLLPDKAKVLLPVPNFFFYKKFERVNRLKFIKIPYQDGLPIRIIDEKLTRGIKAIYLSNPNNPLGYALSVKELAGLIVQAKRINALFVVDEAYFEFCGITVIRLVNKFPNLIVVRTISKAFGLAGTRIGYTITNAKTTRLLEEIRGKLFEVSRLGVEKINKLTLVDFARIHRQALQINQAKKDFVNFLSQNGTEFYPSKTNFITIRVKNSKSVVEKLKNRGILVTNLNNYLDRKKILKNCIRITIPRKSDLLKLKAAFGTAV